MTRDTTFLSDVLARVELSKKMDAWKGKLLIVHLLENKNPVEFRHYYYNSLYIDSNKNDIMDDADKGFFNPGSTVKTAVVLIALERLRELGFQREAEYRILGSDTWFRIDDDIRRIFLISDNDAANRLLLFVGLPRFNERMRAKGFESYIINRFIANQGMGVASPAHEVRFNGQARLELAMDAPLQPYPCLEFGTTPGNCSTATELARVFMRLVQPEFFSEEQRFRLYDSDSSWLQAVMVKVPQSGGFDFPPNYCRFINTVGVEFASQGGRLLSKCGIAPYSYTYTDSSYLDTDFGQKYYIVFALSPPPTTLDTEVSAFMSEVVSTLLPLLP